MPTIRLPSALRSLTGGNSEIVVDAATVRDALAALERHYPGMAAKLLDGSGTVKPYVRIFVGPEDIGALAGLDTQVDARDEIAIVPAIAGG
jgi:sulfur-carrier protein